MVIREGSVRLAVQRNHLGTDLLQKSDTHEGPGAVPTVQDDLYGTWQVEASRQVVYVTIQNVDPFGAPLGSTIDSFANGFEDPAFQVLDRRTVHGGTLDRHFDAVPLRWIVRPGDLYAAVRGERLFGPVERGGRNGTDVDHVRSDAGETTDQGGAQLRRRGAVVAAHRDSWRPAQALPGHRAVRPADGLGDVMGELRRHEATDVVLPEDVIGNGHSGLLLRWR